MGFPAWRWRSKLFAAETVGSPEVVRVLRLIFAFFAGETLVVLNSPFAEL
jgi:hypothetical protein